MPLRLMARHWILVPGIGVRIPEGQPKEKVPVRWYARALFCGFPFLLQEAQIFATKGTKITKGEIEMAFLSYCVTSKK